VFKLAGRMAIDRKFGFSQKNCSQGDKHGWPSLGLDNLLWSLTSALGLNVGHEIWFSPGSEREGISYLKGKYTKVFHIIDMHYPAVYFQAQNAHQIRKLNFNIRLGEVHSFSVVHLTYLAEIVGSDFK
jgi:hypothetical protein